MSLEIIQRLEACRIVPVVILEDANQAVDLARALLAGGIDVIELTMRTAASLDAMRAVAKEVPDMLVGAGTLLSPDDVSACVEAGAKFAVAPGCDPAVVRQAQSLGLPFMPGVMTPSDIACALNLGCKALKFFPAETAGGAPHLKALAAPHAHKGVRFVPTGGITAQTMGDYLSQPAVIAIGGSWLTPKDALKKGDWAKVTQLAKEARAAVPQA
ncbi:MAG: bifunctional 4-hydroxy-2-oxoglutarate aldolase/2-dehydro-3-deoxy-phosphogluconate aldolase [Verrucomicrobiota bacterium JB022]|nr:bifunctional 4-hydroxy-2-oxoglutarate aldolase/2-dehydro-3-deoxy-phosphogluconate aldolase [Verrucomicrobiota bacterium JB022]